MYLLFSCCLHIFYCLFAWLLFKKKKKYLGPPQSVPSLVINSIGGGHLPFNSNSGPSSSLLANSSFKSLTQPSINVLQEGRKIEDDEIFDDDDDDDNDDEGGGRPGENGLEQGLTQGILNKKKDQNVNNSNHSKIFSKIKIVYETPRQLCAILKVIQFRANDLQDGGKHSIVFDRNEYVMHGKKIIFIKNNNNNESCVHMSGSSGNGFTGNMHSTDKHKEHLKTDNNNDMNGSQHIERLYSYHYLCKNIVTMQLDAGLRSLLEQAKNTKQTCCRLTPS
ncbi:C2H2-type zinc finger-containing protein [Reticulomyxa filosa]|uniref:C2H2-type zinc finger-containing protein n=1 Tax=Reticulomyxa filosa TaxID=46433 RepID=X6M5F2_RETFI|nr:C2H2-type zinc finger-containing protein [Reticulomyxa filosa]|eukprot:ETO09213.1 C2H2-type zinc finger-containing protein [Reticulomyxa filosa]